MEDFFKELSGMVEKIQRLEYDFGVTDLVSIAVSSDGYMSIRVSDGKLTHSLSRVDVHSPLVMQTSKELET